MLLLVQENRIAHNSLFHWDLLLEGRYWLSVRLMQQKYTRGQQIT